MADRETILAALYTAIAATVAGVGETLYFERNRNEELEESKCPAVLLWDGDETQVGGRPIGRAPLLLMEMKPEIWLFVTGTKGTLGTVANSLLRRVQRAIYVNTAFVAAVGGMENVDFTSITTGLGKGKKATSDYGIQLTIRYQFHPAS